MFRFSQPRCPCSCPCPPPRPRPGRPPPMWWPAPGRSPTPPSWRPPSPPATSTSPRTASAPRTSTTRRTRLRRGAPPRTARTSVSSDLVSRVPHVTEGDAAIVVRGLRKVYGDRAAVDGIDLEVGQGEVFALLGPNGAGKTTTVEILEGFRKRDGGEVSVLGADPAQ